ncbi:hypothetical protein ABZW50_29260 [Streptomyces bacillaris]
MVEVGVWARAVELLERMEPPNPVAVAALRQAMEHQAGLVPETPAASAGRLACGGPGDVLPGGGIDWSAQ